MQLSSKNNKIFIASKPIDFRMSIDSLARIAEASKAKNVYDGSIFVFYNKNHDRIKCLFWDTNGFVLYYKRLQGTKFKFTKMSGEISTLSPEQLQIILSGYDPAHIEKQSLQLLEKE